MTGQATIPEEPGDAKVLSRLELIARAASLVVGSAPLEERAATLTREVCEAMQADACVIREVRGDLLAILAETGLPQGTAKPVISAREGLGARILAERKPFTVVDVDRDPTTAELAEQSRYEPGKFHFRSFAGAPMLVGEEVVGILGVFTVATSRHFTAEDLLHLQIMANHIGVAIVNQRLYRELSARKRFLEDQERARELLDRGLTSDALHDPGTGLPSRGVFLEHMQHCIARLRRQPGSRFTVALLRPGRLAILSESLGRRGTGELLSVVAQRILEVVRPGDIVARDSAETFALLLEEPALVGGEEETVLNALQAFSQPIIVAEKLVYTSLHIGVVRSNGQATGPDELLHCASIALNRSMEESASGYSVYNPQMHQEARERLTLDSDLHTALERGEIDAVFQPILHASTYMLAGFELLLRWNHPTRGYIPPDDFIPVAERNGVIFQLGQYALARAGYALRHWTSGYRPLNDFFISINVSPLQLEHTRFDKEMIEFLDENGIPAERLKLEITESVVMSRTEVTHQVLERIREHKVDLWIDDFGKGFSSLGRLHRLPFSTLKIDRIFVSSIGESQHSLKIVSAISTLARNLGMMVVCEGIESESQLQIVRRIGCDYIQGFHLSRAMTEEQASRMVVAGETRFD